MYLLEFREKEKKTNILGGKKREREREMVIRKAQGWIYVFSKGTY